MKSVFGPLIVLAMVASAGPTATPWLMVPGLLLGTMALLLVPPANVSRQSEIPPKLFDGSLFAGPVGLLALTEIASSPAYLTFASTMPRWLVSVHGVARDSVLIGWTLATFSLAAAVGGIIAGLLAARVGRWLLVAGTTLLAPLGLFALFQLEPGDSAYFVAVGLLGALAHAGLPLKVVVAQDLAPRAVASASGMLMGFAMGVAVLIYVGVGALQEIVGLAPAANLVFGALVPAALLAFVVLGRQERTESSDGEHPTLIALAGPRCSWPRWYSGRIAEASDWVDAAVAPAGRDPRHAGLASTIDGSSICACGLMDGDCMDGCSGGFGTTAAA